MFDPKKLSYPRVEDGVVLYGPEDWPAAKLAVLQRLSAPAHQEAEPTPDEPKAETPKPRRGRQRKKTA